MMTTKRAILLALGLAFPMTNASAQDFFNPASGATITLIDADVAVVSDVVSATIQPAANLDELQLGVECSGMIVAETPLLRIQYVRPVTPSATSKVAVESVSENVRALLVNSSNGTWYCASAIDGKARWEIAAPNSGQIDVWPVLSSPRLQRVSVRALIEPQTP